MTRVVVYTTDVLGTSVAGPGIRALRFAEALGAVAEVRLISSVQADLERAEFEVILAKGDDLLAHVEWADVLITQSPLLTELHRTETLMVIDLYDPFLLEQLQQAVYLGREVDADFTVRAVNDMLRYADFVICASEKQRDFWLGHLSALGRITPRTYGHDPTLRSLIDVVPFGVDDVAPVQRRHAIRDAVPGIGTDDIVLLWGGGIYDWFDPLTLIRAVALLAPRWPTVRLFFLATHHANPAVGVMRMAYAAEDLARELGVLDEHVFFNQNWVPHEQRADYFMDADIGVSTHLDTLETSFSFRTRLLDYLWAGLPIVNTSGDAFESVIVDHQLGAIVPPGDVDALARALDRMLSDREGLTAMAERARQTAVDFSWSRAMAPLLRFVTDLDPAPDQPRAVGAAGDPGVRAGGLERELEALRSSTSWRITAPLRFLSATVARLRKRS